MTIIIWDIDGVLNPYLANDLAERNFFHISKNWMTVDIDLQDHAAWMRDLESKSTMVWGSSWEDDSNLIADYFWLTKHLDYIKFRGVTHGEDITWKLPSVIKFVDTVKEPIIWLDDEFKQDAYDWAEKRGNTKLIYCDPAVGWTFEQYQQILEFIEEHKHKTLANITPKHPILFKRKKSQ